MSNKKILITGSGTGLGSYAALELARRNHIVYATTKYDNEAEKLNKISIDQKLPLKAFKLDILNQGDIDILKNIDFNVLINNAAIGDSGSISEIDINRIKDVFETNVFGTINITQATIKKFISQKYGRIIFVSSLFGRIPYPFLSPYCASKFSIEAFATCLKKELKKLSNINIQTAIIEPGAYATGFNKENNEKKFEWMNKQSYFKHLIPEIRKKEEKVFNFIEHKNFSTIIKQYIKCVEDFKLKSRYTAPKSQAIFIQLARILGF